MDKKNSLKGISAFALSAVVAVCPIVLYLLLLNKAASSSLMYSADKLWTVIIVSVLCAAVVWLILRRPLYKEEENLVQDECVYDEFEQDEPVQTPSFDNSAAMEEYPELFLEKDVKDDSEFAMPAYYDTLSQMMAAEKREYVPNEDDGAAEILSAREILESGKSFESESADGFGHDMSIYENIPMDLPEGYIGAKVYDPKEDETDDEEEWDAGVEERRKPHIGETVLSKVVIAVSFTLIAFLTSFFFSEEYTLYEKDYVTVSTLGNEVTYYFCEAAEYIVSPSFFGDRLSVEMITESGAKIELLSSGQFMGEKFFDEFDSIYEYGAYVCEKMNGCGIQKTVLERKTIEGEFLGADDKTEEYIKRIID